MRGRQSRELGGAPPWETLATCRSGYDDPDRREEFWILDVEGTRLMIAAERSPGAPPEDLAEQRAILDSIGIEP
jgi:hypothetical protein